MDERVQALVRLFNTIDEKYPDLECKDMVYILSIIVGRFSARVTAKDIDDICDEVSNNTW